VLEALVMSRAFDNCIAFFDLRKSEKRVTWTPDFLHILVEVVARTGRALRW
jgi:hypothetical protein